MKMQTCSFSDNDITTQIFLVKWKSNTNIAAAHYNLFGYLYTLVCPSEIDAVAPDENHLTCDECSLSHGPSPNACNGTGYIELGIYSTME